MVPGQSYGPYCAQNVEVVENSDFYFLFKKKMFNLFFLAGVNYSYDKKITVKEHIDGPYDTLDDILKNNPDIFLPSDVTKAKLGKTVFIKYKDYHDIKITTGIYEIVKTETNNIT